MRFERPVLVALFAASVLIVTIALGFGFVDASVLDSETAVDSSVGTSQIDNASASLDGPVTLYVAGDGWLEARMTDRLAEELADRGATVNRVESLEGDSEDPILAVVVAESSVTYSPIAPTSTVKTDLAYVHSGNATLASSMTEGEPAVVGNRDAYVVGGEVTVSDRSRGLATWPAYQRRVATASADAVIDALTSAPGMDQPN